MNCYVKFSYGWEYVEQSANSYLTNALDETVFALDDSNRELARLISEGVELEYLEERY